MTRRHWSLALAMSGRYRNKFTHQVITTINQNYSNLFPLDRQETFARRQGRAKPNREAGGCRTLLGEFLSRKWCLSSQSSNRRQGSQAVRQRRTWNRVHSSGRRRRLHRAWLRRTVGQSLRRRRCDHRLQENSRESRWALVGFNKSMNLRAGALND